MRFCTCTALILESVFCRDICKAHVARHYETRCVALNVIHDSRAHTHTQTRIGANLFWIGERERERLCVPRDVTLVIYARKYEQNTHRLQKQS